MTYVERQLPGQEPESVIIDSLKEGDRIELTQYLQGKGRSASVIKIDWQSENCNTCGIWSVNFIKNLFKRFQQNQLTDQDLMERKFEDIIVKPIDNEIINSNIEIVNDILSNIKHQDQKAKATELVQDYAKLYTHDYSQRKRAEYADEILNKVNHFNSQSSDPVISTQPQGDQVTETVQPQKASPHSQRHEVDVDRKIYDNIERDLNIEKDDTKKQSLITNRNNLDEEYAMRLQREEFKKYYEEKKKKRSRSSPRGFGF